jgi:hypothetical protein
MVRADLIGIVASIAIALLPNSETRKDAQQHSTARLPTRGVLVVGKNLAGVEVGQTQARVRRQWGPPGRVCTTYPCTDPTWIYLYPRGEPLGAAVRFRKKKVVAVFTLGAVPGWRSTNGITIAEPASEVYKRYPKPKYTKCIGFEALSIPGNGVVTSFYLTSGVVYGFALTVPGLTVCQ